MCVCVCVCVCVCAYVCVYVYAILLINTIDYNEHVRAVFVGGENAIIRHEWHIRMSAASEGLQCKFSGPLKCLVGCRK